MSAPANRASDLQRKKNSQIGSKAPQYLEITGEISSLKTTAPLLQLAAGYSEHP